LEAAYVLQPLNDNRVGWTHADKCSLHDVATLNQKKLQGGRVAAQLRRPFNWPWLLNLSLTTFV
jgi:hypothetical protein